VSRIADDFGIATVVVPWGAGVASAIGLVSADLGAERRRPFASDLDAVDAAQLAHAFADLEQRARAETDAGEGRCEVSRFVGMRVRGQVHALDVRVPDGPLDAAIGELPARFTEQYLAAYGVPPAAKLQLTAARVRAVSAAVKHAPAAAAVEAAAGIPSPAGERPAHFAERGGFVPTPVFDWTRLVPGTRITGPAIVEGPDTTVVVLPDRIASIDRWRNVVLSR
jgi:N-methylhydantoinase A/oxoprolinase/acetone carboxylase beta subunit